MMPAPGTILPEQGVEACYTLIDFLLEADIPSESQRARLLDAVREIQRYADDMPEPIPATVIADMDASIAGCEGWAREIGGVS